MSPLRNLGLIDRDCKSLRHLARGSQSQDSGWAQPDGLLVTSVVCEWFNVFRKSHNRKRKQASSKAVQPKPDITNSQIRVGKTHEIEIKDLKG